MINRKWTSWAATDNRTTIEDYLRSIFPDEEWMFTDWIETPSKDEAIEVDVSGKKSKILIYLLWPETYMDSSKISKAITDVNDLMDAGHNVAALPYWVPLTKDAIEFYFGVQVEGEYAEDVHPFLEVSGGSVSFDVFPGNMCELGRKQFINQFNKLPVTVRQNVFSDMMIAAGVLNGDPQTVEYLVPKYVVDQLALSDFTWQYDTLADDREIMLFGSEYNPLNYASGLLRTFHDVDYLTARYLIDNHITSDRNVLDTMFLSSFLSKYTEWKVGGCALAFERRIEEGHGIIYNELSVTGSASEESTTAINELLNSAHIAIDECIEGSDKTRFVFIKTEVVADEN